MNNLPPFGVGPFCQYRGIPVNCGPRGLKGSRDRLYHNNGDGTFTDVTEKLNIDPDRYYGLGVLWLDYDKDGCLDLYVADDSSPSLLYHNNCKGGFEEVGAEAGVAYSSDGHEQAGMGIDSADYDRDGWPDILKTNFSDDSNNLYHNDHNGEFTDMAGPAGIGAISYPYLGFGAKFLDYDNDGWPDIFIANGHVDAQVEGQSFGVGYAERPFLFHNLGYQKKIGKFDEIAEKSSPALAKKYIGRAALAADFWNRGRQDLLFTVMDGSPVLLRNEVPSPGHWLRIKTIGHKSNRDGFGAQVEITAGRAPSNTPRSAPTAALKVPATPASISAWARPPASTPSQCAGRAARSTTSAPNPPTRSSSLRKAAESWPGVPRSLARLRNASRQFPTTIATEPAALYKTWKIHRTLHSVCHSFTARFPYKSMKHNDFNFGSTSANLL